MYAAAEYCFPSNRNKPSRNPKSSTNNENIEIIHEAPVRDTTSSKMDDSKHVNYEGSFPPPEPPMGQYGEWELQFCKWWGWTWVRKSDRQQCGQQQRYISNESTNENESRSQQNNNNNPQKKKKKKKCCLLCCFKANEEPRKTQSKSQLPPSADPSMKRINQNTEQIYQKNDFGEQCCCCCGNAITAEPLCCPCSTICCPCGQMQQMCCPCMNQRQQEPPPQVERRRDSKTIETQTCRNCKEQGTAISEMHVPKNKVYCARCRPRRQCPCAKPVCCPCKGPICCPCMQQDANIHNNNNKNMSHQSNLQWQNDPVVHYCLTNHNKPSFTDLIKYKTGNFSTLSKSLDILLRNNINIMSLFNEKKTLGNDHKASTFLDSNHTISCLSATDNVNKSDKEHCKLLTAVCDAILSNHKFDEEKCNPLVNASSSKSTCDTQDSTFSFINPATRGILDRVLKKEDITTKLMQYSSTKRPTFSRILGMNNRQKLVSIKHAKKVKSIRRNSSLYKCLNEGKHMKQTSVNNSNINIKSGDNNNNNNLPMKLDQGSNTMDNQGTSQSPDNLEKLLASINFINSNYSKTEDDKINKYESIFNDRHVDFLEATSPPFTTQEATEESKANSNKSSGK